MKSQRLRLCSQYYFYSDPPDKHGDEVLWFVSPQRRLKLKGHAFREFVQYVAPLLDGKHSVEEIETEVGDLFAPSDLEQCLEFLSEQGIIEDPAVWSLDEAGQERVRPLLNLFNAVSEKPWELQQRLARSRVAVFGLTAVGAAAARSLAACGVGTLRCIDPEVVGRTDCFYSGSFSESDVGQPRVEAFRRRVTCSYEPLAGRLTEDAQVESAIADCNFVVNAMDEGNLSLMYRLNRATLRTRTPWISTSAAGFEAIVGPVVYPEETACYMCYRMRLVACAEDPESAFDFESFLDRRKSDDGARRACLPGNAAIAGEIAAVEVLKALTGLSKPATRGRIQVFDMRDLTSTLHAVLRKPWCPACMALEPR